MAWQRPDVFRKVLSHVGSFTNIRGGHVYPAMIRKSEQKPIRVFLQGGSEDLDNEHGNWPLANQQMAASLKFAGYDSKRSEEHTSELQSLVNLVCRLLLEKKIESLLNIPCFAMTPPHTTSISLSLTTILY